MNYMSQVAKLLGVELGEEFEINENKHWICSFTESQFKVSSKDKAYVNASLGEHVLAELIGGVYTVKRKPWMPEHGEYYYFVDKDGDIRADRNGDVTVDLLLYKTGNCYRTFNAAKENAQKWKDFYASNEVLEV